MTKEQIQGINSWKQEDAPEFRAFVYTGTGAVSAHGANSLTLNTSWYQYPVEVATPRLRPRRQGGKPEASTTWLADTLAGMNLAPRSSADPISTTSHGLTVIKGGAVSLNVPEHVVVPFTSRGSDESPDNVLKHFEHI
ncbi:hypothetical protein B0H14DRAFT_2638301 [Mycena olivaceomarginata]|nr:hypothetical protein B0H14DRAFT_2638301 [Mycena olivaceomarginata]